MLITPIGTVFSETAKQIVEKLFEDKEIKVLEKEMLKEKIKNIKEDTETKELEQKKIEEEITNIKIDSELKLQRLSKSTVITKKKSNFYDALEKYPKVKQISITIEDNEKDIVTKEQIIHRSTFKDFILVSNNLDPIQVNDAIIEIISPVLKKGEYKWKGIYEGKILSFTMKSNEFKTKVQAGKIEFKNGFSIKCLLEIKRIIDNNGYEKITDYNIIRVNEYFENDKPIETQEGKKYRQKQKADERQYKFVL
ncbi:hypothetical protein Barb4_02330 [Bacteroidales bacterium Barb4]|nr:hypothetical protein Barb4_02330 [Bacteroidales bacterium Barb4]